MYQHQSSLPSLPVPDLKETCALYLDSCKPLLSQDEYEKTRVLVQDFVKPGGIGEELDAQLRAKADASKPSNWLTDWWLKYAYHNYEAPIPVYSNYGLYVDRLAQPWSQIDGAAIYTEAVFQYYQNIVNETIKPEQVGGRFGPYLDMNQYKFMFGSTRLPGDPCDSASTLSICPHIVVICKRQYFKLDLTGLTVKDIAVHYNRILEAASQPEGDMVEHGGLGLLTAGTRSDWARARTTLLKDTESAQTLKDIEQACFLVVLDEEAPKVADILQECQTGDANNRFFDKVVTLLAFSNGELGMNCEHSPADAMCTVQLMKFVEKFLGNADALRGDGAGAPPLQRLVVNLSPEVADVLPRKQKEWEELKTKLRISVFHFGDYGKEAIKSWRISPDSFIQMALQLAHLRLHGEVVSTYETSMTRLFYKGRTATCRSASQESTDFARVMDDTGASAGEKKSMLMRAVKSHQSYVKAAAYGKGCDRYLMGLKILTLESGKPLHPMFEDVAYIRSTAYRMSTSNVSPSGDTFGGFGPTSPDGYGICYATHKRGHLLKFAVATNPSDALTDVDKMQDAIDAALKDMGALYGGKAIPPPMFSPGLLVAAPLVAVAVYVLLYKAGYMGESLLGGYTDGWF